jgi:tetratricopeptide (TPR) repeat protein
MLARLVALAGDDATVLVVAHPGGSAAGRGLFVAAGPGLRRDELIHGAGPLDIAPTVLALFGLPTADDLPGRPLVAAWQRPPRVASIASWDDRVARPDPADSDSDSDPAGAVADLVAQGYDDGPPPWLPELVRRSRLVEDFHRAMVHLDARRPARAAEALERLHDEAPGDVAVALYLAYAHAAVGNAARARELLGSIGDDHEDRPLRELVEAMILIGEGHSSEAAARLDRAVATHRAVPEVFTLIGHADLTAGRPEAAARSFARALAIDGERADAHEGLAQAHLRLRRWEAAADASLSALGLDHHRPEAHLTLGLALRELGRLDRAAQAFRTALDLRPTLRSRP